MAVSFIGGGNRRTRWKPSACRKSLTHFYHIMLCTSPWARFELTTSVVIGTDCIGSCKSSYHTITVTTAPYINMQQFSVRKFKNTSVKHVIIQKVTSWDHLIAHIFLLVVSGDTLIPKFPAQMSHIVIYKTVYPWVPVKAFLQPTNTIHNFIPFLTLRTGQQCGVSPSSIFKPPRYI